MFATISEVESLCEENMNKALHALNDELAKVRSGRASIALFDKIRVDYYGSPTPLNQLANISLPEARLIVIQPFDKNTVSDIEKALLASDLSLNPSNDGNVIRINVPAMTEEKRKEQVKLAKSMGEKSKVALRNVRRDINEKIKKASEFAEDDQKRGSESVQKITDAFVEKVGQIVTNKEKEILEI